MNNISKIALTTLGFVSLTVQAELAGAQSDAANTVNYIAVGGTNYTSQNGHPGNSGGPGIMIHKMSPDVNDRKYVSLLGLQVLSWPNLTDGVTHIDKNTFGMPSSHKKNVGTLDFAKVPNWNIFESGVYFGEWSQNGELNALDRQVWYVGKDKTTNMPTGGIANYDVKGIRQYQHNGILTGTLTANFGTNELYGNVGDINFGSAGNTTVSINASQASFGGGVSVGSVQGNTQGHFFHSNAERLAGIATFATNKNLDTSFGGKKN